MVHVLARPRRGVRDPYVVVQARDKEDEATKKALEEISEKMSRKETNLRNLY